MKETSRRGQTKKIPVRCIFVSATRGFSSSLNVKCRLEACFGGFNDIHQHGKETPLFAPYGVTRFNKTSFT